MDYDITSQLATIPITLDAEARERLLARLKVLWATVKPADRPNLTASREADLPRIAYGLQFWIVDGKLKVTVPANLATAWAFLKMGSFSHKAIQNLEAEVLAAAQP